MPKFVFLEIESLEVIVGEEMMAKIPSPPPGDSHVANWAKAFEKHCVLRECTLGKELRNRF